MRNSWWKVLCVLLIGFSIIGGFLVPVPRLFVLNETVRNLYYHVPMWFTMIVLFAVGFTYSIKYLRSNNLVHDIYAAEFTNVGIAFSIYGMITGMQWAKYTWLQAWSNDPKQVCTALSMLTYFAYAILRGGMKDEEKRARVSAVYNIFVFALMIPLITIIPRMYDSLHPGGSGNPGFNQYDRDTNMNLVFYSAGIGWILFGVWMSTLRIRMAKIELKREGIIT
jgi:heme exporter protein C